MLGFGRALGETMAVTMVIGNNPQVSLVAVRAAVHDGGGHRQRVHRGRRRAATCTRSSRSGWCCSSSRSSSTCISRAADLVDGRASAAAAAAGAPLRRGGGRMMRDRCAPGCCRTRDRRRCAALSVLLALVPLAFILFFVVTQGIAALNSTFFTHMPKPVGEPGGGMANAIVGTLIVVGARRARSRSRSASSAASTRRSTRARSSPTAVRFAADTLNGVPSIVIGVFVYGIAVLPFKQFSALAGGVALGIMMIPIITRTTEELLRLVPRHAARRRAGARRDARARRVHGGAAGGAARHHHRHRAGAGAHRRRDGAAALHVVQQPVLHDRPRASRSRR